MPEFTSEGHCHWEYRVGGYRSFLNWSTREGLEQHLHDGGYDLDSAEIYKVHGRSCKCDPTDPERADLPQAPMRGTP